MIEWIITNASWLVPLIASGIAAVWTYLTNKKNKALQQDLQAAQVKLQEAQVDTAHIELNVKVNQAVDAALDRAIKLHENELARLTSLYERQIEDMTAKIAKAEALKDQATNLASTYEGLIDKLKTYNTYLKTLLDENDILYKGEDEII